MTDEGRRPVKVTLLVWPRNWQAVNRLTEMTGRNHEACINNAIELYAEVMEKVILPGYDLAAVSAGFPVMPVGKVTANWFINDDRDEGHDG